MKKRTLIGIGLVMIIIVGLVVGYINRDVLLTNQAVITYPDGCVEIYKNAVLTSPKCDTGNISVDIDKFYEPQAVNFSSFEEK